MLDAHHVVGRRARAGECRHEGIVYVGGVLVTVRLGERSEPGQVDEGDASLEAFTCCDVGSRRAMADALDYGSTAGDVLGSLADVLRGEGLEGSGCGLLAE